MPLLWLILILWLGLVVTSSNTLPDYHHMLHERVIFIITYIVIISVMPLLWFIRIL